MKFEHFFTLTVIMIILFSLATVTASENITDDAPLDDNSKISAVNDIVNDKLGENEDNDSPLIDEAKNNLTISIYAEKNMINNDCYWNITATLSNGTAYNTTIKQLFSDNVAYVSHNVTIGTFNSTTGIWDLGNLTSSDKATLRIFTKLTDNKTFSSSTTVKTDSKDVYVNPKIIPEVIPVYYTETTDGKNDPNHDDHPNSYENYYVIRIDDNPVENNTDSNPPDTPQETEQNEKTDPPTDSNLNTKSNSDANSKSDSNTDESSRRNSNNNHISKTILNNNNLELITKTTKSISNIISKSYETIAKSIGNVLNPTALLNNNDSDLNISDEVIKAIPAYDYTRIPILIFTAFLIILLALVGYDKVKN